MYYFIGHYPTGGTVRGGGGNVQGLMFRGVNSLNQLKHGIDT